MDTKSNMEKILITEIPRACCIQGIALHDPSWRAPAPSPAQDALQDQVNAL